MSRSLRVFEVEVRDKVASAIRKLLGLLRVAIRLVIRPAVTGKALIS